MSSESFDLAKEVVDIALERGLRIAVAESLTGGLLAASIVSVPGVSPVFSGGIVAYDVAVKANLLGVSKELLKNEGAVTEAVAIQMARGARKACSVPNDAGVLKEADIAVSTTGVAGPDADVITGQEPGTVWIGISFEPSDGLQVFANDYAVLLPKVSGTREEIRAATVIGALKALKQKLESL